MNAQSDAQRLQADMAIAQQREQNENQRTQAEIQARNTQNEADNLTALKLAELEITSGEKFAVTTGTGINP
jgi:ABC-type transport system involved in cytochrome bd biosynthesis fused ATPase/permease subunit